MRLFKRKEKFDKWVAIQTHVNFINDSVFGTYKVSPALHGYERITVHLFQFMGHHEVFVGGNYGGKRDEFYKEQTHKYVLPRQFMEDIGYEVLTQ